MPRTDTIEAASAALSVLFQGASQTLCAQHKLCRGANAILRCWDYVRDDHRWLRFRNVAGDDTARLNAGVLLAVSFDFCSRRWQQSHGPLFRVVGLQDVGAKNVMRLPVQADLVFRNHSDPDFTDIF